MRCICLFLRYRVSYHTYVRERGVERDDERRAR